MAYPRDTGAQCQLVADYRQRIAQSEGQNKPVMQSLYIDLVDDADAAPRPIHLGFQSGTRFLAQYLQELQSVRINPVALNLRFNHADIETTMRRLSDDLQPVFAN